MVIYFSNIPYTKIGNVVDVTLNNVKNIVSYIDCNYKKYSNIPIDLKLHILIILIVLHIYLISKESISVPEQRMLRKMQNKIVL